MLTRLIVLGLLIGVWLALDTWGEVPGYILPQLSSVFAELRFHLLEGLAWSLGRALIAFSIGLVFAYMIFFVTTYFNAVEIFDEQFAAARAIPVMAVMPLFVVWFGFSEFGRLLLLVFSMQAFLLAPIHSSFRELPVSWTLLRKYERVSYLSFFLRVLVPGSFGMIVGSMRIVIALSFTLSIAVDYMGAEKGVGVFLNTARVTFNVPAIYCGVLLSAFCGILLDKTYILGARYFVHWAQISAK